MAPSCLLSALTLAVGLALGLPVAAVQAQPAGAAASGRFDFDLAPQPLSQAVNLLAQATRLQVLAPPELLAGKRAPRLQGRYTAEEALRRLLAESGIQYRFTDESTVIFSPARPGPPARRDDAQTTLDAVEVYGQKAGRPWNDSNLDIVRTISDPQPYYIFDSEAIGRAGVANVEDFLKQRLTMNTMGETYSQTSSQLGNSSQVNLRGLGTDKTLILINGRRMSGATLYGSAYQPDLNSIPVSMIDRIEILPTSASGIYGGSAMGGVVNVILRKDYVGSEIKLSYENAFDTDVSTRTVSFSTGHVSRDERTRVMLSGQRQDGSSLLFGDRGKEISGYARRIQANSPSFPVLGRTPNIRSTDDAELVLRDGTPLGSNITHIDAGAHPGMPAGDVRAMLVRNAGSYNIELAPTVQSNGGLLRELGKPRNNESLMASVRHDFGPRVQAYLDFNYSKNVGRSQDTTFNYEEFVSADAPTNPFGQDVYVRWPNTVSGLLTTIQTYRNLSTGMVFEISDDWSAAVDYTYSQNKYVNRSNSGIDADWTALDSGLADGSINPFVDTLLYPQITSRHLAAVYPPQATAHVRDLTARVHGPVFRLPGGNTATLTAGFTWRSEGYDTATGNTDYATTDARDNYFTFFGKSQVAKSVYVELLSPLVSEANAVPLVKSLDLQLAVRSERYDVDGGTNFMTCYYNLDPVACTYSPNSETPYTETTRYNATSPTVALKYQPLASLMLRASYGKAFLPPTYSQLLENALLDTTPSTIRDPANGATYQVPTRSGGNAGLTPVNAESWNLGAVWTPEGALTGLRVSLERYRIVQDDVIGALSAQDLVNMEDRFPDRVTRDPQTGLVTLVNRSSMNLTRYETQGWDLNVDWNRPIAHGTLWANLLGTYISSERRQLVLDGPYAEYAGYVNNGGPLKFKSNATLGWEYGDWGVSWSVRYFDSYRQAQAPGSPYYVQNPNAGPNTYYTDAQGADKVASQIYHDVMATWRPGAGSASEGAGVVVQVGIKNLFDKVPPMDVYNVNDGWYSPFGDMRLRTYYLSLTKRF